MSESRLFPSRRCKEYFGIRRLDRKIENGTVKRVHMRTVALVRIAGRRIFMRDAQTHKPPPNVFVYISNIDIFVTFVHCNGVKIGTYYIY